MVKAQVILCVAAVLSGCARLSGPTLVPTADATAFASPTPAVLPTATPTSAPTSTPQYTPTPSPIGGGAFAFVLWECPTWLYVDSGYSPQIVPIQIPNAMFPRWSPDHRSLGFLQMQGTNLFCHLEKSGIQEATLLVMSPEATAPKPIARLSIPVLYSQETGLPGVGRFFYWSPDGSRIAYTNYLSHDRSPDNPLRMEIMVVDIATAHSHKLAETTLAWDDASYQSRLLAWSPDSAQIAFTNYGTDDFGLYVADADGTAITRIVPRRYIGYPQWIDTNTIVVQQTDVLPHCASKWPRGYPIPILCYSAGKLWQVASDGGGLRVLADNGQEATLNADRSALAYVERSRSPTDAKDTVIVLRLPELARTAVATVCGFRDDGYRLRWSPNGQLVAFMSDVPSNDGTECTLGEGDTPNILVYGVQAELIFKTDANMPEVFDFSPDSTWFISNGPGGPGGFEHPQILSLLQLQPRFLSQEPFLRDLMNAAWQPDS